MEQNIDDNKIHNSVRVAEYGRIAEARNHEENQGIACVLLNIYEQVRKDISEKTTKENKELIDNFGGYAQAADTGLDLKPILIFDASELAEAIQNQYGGSPSVWILKYGDRIFLRLMNVSEEVLFAVKSITSGNCKFIFKRQSDLPFSLDELKKDYVFEVEYTTKNEDFVELFGNKFKYPHASDVLDRDTQKNLQNDWYKIVSAYMNAAEKNTPKARAVFAESVVNLFFFPKECEDSKQRINHRILRPLPLMILLAHVAEVLSAVKESSKPKKYAKEFGLDKLSEHPQVQIFDELKRKLQEL